MRMLEPSPEAIELAAQARRLLERSWPVSRNRVAMDAGLDVDPAAWADLAALGVAGLLVPSSAGGADGGPAEMTLLCEEFGRVLLPNPFWSSAVISAGLLARLAPDHPLLPQIADGAIIATTAFLDEAGQWNGQPAIDATSVGVGGCTLRGTAPFVTDAIVADVMLVVARLDGELALAAVDRRGIDAAALAVTDLECLDRTRMLRGVEFLDAPAVILATGPEVAAALDEAECRGIVASLAAAVGAAQRALEMTAEYARTRVQFGAIIGGYQSIKHHCANMVIDIESARSAVHHAAAALDDDPAQARRAASIAAVWCGERLLRCASLAIQVHGGIGFTWDHDIQLYFKRAQLDAHFLGSPAVHRRRLATQLRLVGVG